MRFQSHKADCGPTALKNALELIGVKRTTDELATLAGTTAKGTDEFGILAALKAIGRTGTTIFEKVASCAGYNLWYQVNNGNPVLCCVDDWDHWVAVIGICGDRIIVIDSADSELVLNYSLNDFLVRWYKSGKGGGFYGIVV